MKYISSPFILLLFLYWNISPLFSQNTSYYFKHITPEQGLSQHTVLCILQDKQGFMWFGTKDGVNRYDGTHFKIYSTDNTKGEIQDCVINCLCETNDGKIWAGTNKGISIYNPETESFHEFDIYRGIIDKEIRRPIKDIKQDQWGNVWIADFYRGIYCFKSSTDSLEYIGTNSAEQIVLPSRIFEDKEGKIWVSTLGNALYYYNPDTNFFENFEIAPFPELDVKRLSINSIIDIGKELYLGTYNHGLFKLNPATSQLTKVRSSDNEPSPLYIQVLARINSNEIWIGTETGIYIYNERLGQYTNIKKSDVDKFALSDNTIFSLYKDRDNGIWVGTYFGGINYLPYQSAAFNKWYPLKDGKTISGKVIRDLREDENGFIWIGTEDNGLNRYDPKTGSFKHCMISHPDKKDYDNIRALDISGDELWIGVHSKSISVLNLKTGKIKHYEKDRAPTGIYSLLIDRMGNIWAGDQDGVYLFDKESDSFRKKHEFGNFFFYDIREDYLGNIWLVAISNGAFCYNPNTKSIKRYVNDPNDSTSVPTKVTGIFEDSMNRMWFTTEGWGFCRFDRDTETFKHYTLDNGLPNSVVYHMTEDINGMIWFGTNKGLVKFNPNTEEMKVFTQGDGLLCEQFNYKAALTTKDGIVYMGSLEGLMSFNPVTFKKKVRNSFSPVLTGFQIFNEEVKIGKDSPLTKSISLTQEIALSYKQNSLSFDFASLNYNSPKDQPFTYILQGLEYEWHLLKENQKISYSNLPPGDYTLKIKKSAEGKEETSLRIVIKPPVWLTPYAYTFYAILILLLLFFIYKKSAMRIKTRYKQDIIKLQTQKEKETYDAKIAFFTNVAHEVRTPLSLIKGPLEYILKQNKVDKETRQDLLIMQRNSDRLLTLINQLLDFRKTESGKFSLSFRRHNITELIMEQKERFMPIFRQKDLEVEMVLPEEVFFAEIDKEAFIKIMSNLYINASKFACRHIKVELSAKHENGFFSFSVKNDGDIIKEEMFEKIFEPFFQVDSDSGENMKTGTGIGLSLSRNLSELHGGRLYIQKESSLYNTFILELPINQVNVVAGEEGENNTSLELTNMVKNDNDREKYKVLVIEDNIEMQNFLIKQLNQLYLVYGALNGKEALKILDTEYIDLTISDIAMPEMNGYELMKIMKSTIKYSHIPIILLTARTSIESKIEGLSLGADAYIEKPFSMDFLHVQINNLLNGRKKLKDSFINSPYLYSNTIALTKADEEFMEKVNEIIEQNLDNVEFNIGQLSYAMNVSNSSLLRKIKGISGLTVNEYIRLLRLKKAALLLEENKYRINEICSLTGFNNPSYFAKCFYKQFGILPKDFINKK